MYTEIKEAVAFLFRFYRNNQPRRRISLLMAEFGSQLALNYQESWDISDPKKGEEARMVDFCVKDGRGAVLDKLFVAAAEEMICTEVLMKSPDIKLYVNPGSVFYTCHSESSPTSIWTGKVDADLNYNPCVLGSMTSRTSSGSLLLAMSHHVYLSGDAKNFPFNAEIEDSTPLVLHLVDCHPLVSPSPIGKPIKKFAYHSPDYKPVTVAAFAKTRFGSSKTRPDHDYYRRLQVAAGQATFPQAFHHVAVADNDNGDRLMRSLLFSPLSSPTLQCASIPSHYQF